jgi:hypothetical protein
MSLQQEDQSIENPTHNQALGHFWWWSLLIRLSGLPLVLSMGCHGLSMKNRYGQVSRFVQTSPEFLVDIIA